MTSKKKNKNILPSVIWKKHWKKFILHFFIKRKPKLIIIILKCIGIIMVSFSNFYFCAILSWFHSIVHSQMCMWIFFSLYPKLQCFQWKKWWWTNNNNVFYFYCRHINVCDKWWTVIFVLLDIFNQLVFFLFGLIIDI